MSHSQNKYIITLSKEEVQKQLKQAAELYNKLLAENGFKKRSSTIDKAKQKLDALIEQLKKYNTTAENTDNKIDDAFHFKL